MVHSRVGREGAAVLGCGVEDLGGELQQVGAVVRCVEGPVDLRLSSDIEVDARRTGA